MSESPSLLEMLKEEEIVVEDFMIGEDLIQNLAALYLANESLLVKKKNSEEVKK